MISKPHTCSVQRTSQVAMDAMNPMEQYDSSPLIGSSFAAHQHIHQDLSLVPRFVNLIGPSYHCKICKQYFFVREEDHPEDGNWSDIIRNHCSSEEHVSRVTAIAALQSCSMSSWCAKMQCRMEQCGGTMTTKSPSRQQDVTRDLFWILLNYRGWRAAQVDYAHLKEDVEHSIRIMESKEPCVLLYLAAWKAICMATPPENEHTDNYHFWCHWIGNGWKEAKDDVRQLADMSTVVESVLPFLYDEDDGSEYTEHTPSDLSYVSEESLDNHFEVMTEDELTEMWREALEYGDSNVQETAAKYYENMTFRSTVQRTNADTRTDAAAESFDSTAMFCAHRHAHRTWKDEDGVDVLHQAAILRHVRVEKDGTDIYACKLCQVELAQGSHQHRFSSAHLSRVEQVEATQLCPLTVWCGAIQCRMEAFGRVDEAWQVDATCGMFWMLLYSKVWEPDCKPLKDVQDRVEAMVAKHEETERTALLELVVWKAACILNPQPGAITDFHSWHEWMEQGWKANQSAMRRCNEIHIIFLRVRPFF